MTYAARETSRTKAVPISLLFFRYGEDPDQYYAYTDADDDIVHSDGDGLSVGDVTYESVTIKRGEVSSTGTLDKTRFTINLPQNSTLYQLFNPVPPSYNVTLVVREGHVGEAEFKVSWVGRVLGFGDVESRTDLVCEPFITSMKRQMATRTWQFNCPHDLYVQGDGLCNADKAYATVTKTVAGVSGPIVTLETNWVSEAEREKHQGGFVQWTRADGRKEIRPFLRPLNSSQILLGGVASGLEIGDDLILTRGCDRTKGVNGCAGHRETGTAHSNINNYGGMPNIPGQNPFGVKNIYN